MAQPRLDDALIEYEFSVAESLSARILDSLRIAWLQTKYSQYFKMKASQLVPESVELDRSYIQKICELDGKMNAIQELLDDHKKALLEMQGLNKETSAGGEVKIDAPVRAIAHQASDLVHKQP